MHAVVFITFDYNGDWAATVDQTLNTKNNVVLVFIIPTYDGTKQCWNQLLMRNDWSKKNLKL